MNPFGSWTAINLSLKAWKVLQRHSRQMKFQYSSSFFPTFLIFCLSNWHRKASFPTAISTVLKKFRGPLPNYGDSLRNHLTGAIDNTQSDYQHAVTIYQNFGCRNLGDYQNNYLKTQVLLQADIFEKLRNVCLKVYTLDPSYFYLAPNLDWQSMLNSTNVKMGLLQDVDTLLFFERGIRGGINGLGELPHFTANKPHLNSFDQNEKA